MDIPIDLSKVYWIATANDLSRVPSYIRDRCKIIEVPAYGPRGAHGHHPGLLPGPGPEQLRLAVCAGSADSVAARSPGRPSSLREARQMLVDLVARELSGKKPHTFKSSRSEPGTLPSCGQLRSGEHPRRIGFALREAGSEEPARAMRSRRTHVSGEALERE